jgi:hypothetical protein
MLPMRKSLLIGPYEYRVRVLDSELRDANGDLLWGRIDHSSQEIVLGPAPSQERLWAALLHEAMHGILANAGITDSSEKVEVEKVIEILGTGLIALLIDNGLLAGGEADGNPDSKAEAETRAVGDGRNL